MAGGRFELFESAPAPTEDPARRWRWRLLTPDRDITLMSQTPFENVTDAHEDAVAVRAAAASAPIHFVIVTDDDDD